MRCPSSGRQTSGLSLCLAMLLSKENGYPRSAAACSYSTAAEANIPGSDCTVEVLLTMQQQANVCRLLCRTTVQYCRVCCSAAASARHSTLVLSRLSTGPHSKLQYSTNGPGCIHCHVSLAYDAAILLRQPDRYGRARCAIQSNTTHHTVSYILDYTITMISISDTALLPL